jgi:hypothetical protein
MPKSDGRPKLHPLWRKGQSVNPQGRLKRAYLEVVRAIAKAEDADAPSAADVIKHHLRKMNLNCAQNLVNRAYRKPETVDRAKRRKIPSSTHAHQS